MQFASLFSSWARLLRCQRPHRRLRGRRPARRSQHGLTVEVLEDRLSPATLTVNSTADTASPSDPYLSLREAIAIVNSPTLPDGLSAQILGQISGTLHYGGADTIVFDHTAVNTAITLGGSQLELSLPDDTAQVTIDGGAAGVTLDGNNTSRVFQVDGGVQATLQHLTITNGKAFGTYSQGGGIYAASGSRLSVSSSTLTGNSATFGGGISAVSSTLSVSDSTLQNNHGAGFGMGLGGGIDASSCNLTVSNTILTGNSAGGCGGISATGTLTVSHCTLTSNYGPSGSGGIGASGTVMVSDSTLTDNHGSSNGPGGGIGASGSVTVSRCTLTNNSSVSGGGLYTYSGNVMVSNCTLTGNSAFSGSGIYTESSNLTVSNCTLTGNTVMVRGGGIEIRAGLGATLLMQNTIVAGNGIASHPAADIDGAVTPASSYNLVGQGDSYLIGISNGVNHNQIGTSASPIDPLLSPLNYYGGPTRTFPLLPGSPALATGNPVGAPATDQRGLPRVVDGQTDLGAFQTQADPLLITTLADPGQVFGQLALREAIRLAGVLPGTDTVSFDPGLANGTVTLTAGELLLGHDVAIAGPAAGSVTVSGGNASRVFEVAAGVSASLTGLTVAGGRVNSRTQAQGGGILNAGSLTLTDCTVANNQVAGGQTGTGTEVVLSQGGGIYTSGALTLTRCTVSGNTATLAAGNVYAGNANGGGLYDDGGLVTVTDSTVSGNSAVATFLGGSGVVFGYGGGLTIDNGTLALTDSTVNGNSATGGNAAGFGGGIHTFQSTVTLSNCTIAGNTATSTGDAGFGGGVSGLDTSLTLTSCTVTGNSANSVAGTGSGGGLYSNSGVGSAQLLNTIVAGNSSGSDGPDASGSFASQGFNLIGITDGSSGWVSSDLTGTASSPLDPLLGTLGDYGGPTATVPLLAGSPALNAGDPSQLGSADQRGAIRSRGVNIGAFQASAASFVVSAPASVSSGVPFDVSVAVYDAFGQLAVGYSGTIHFSSTDGDPNVVLPADYTFGVSDGGSVTFSGGVTLITPGSQTLTATDLSGGISGSIIVTL
jgi:hypothetical protein